MDAPGDRDIELQRASGDLLDEFNTRLPPLLWKSSGNKPQLHQWAQCGKTQKLRSLLEPFQEWPQLLDPHLHGILSQLTEAFLIYLRCYRDTCASVSVSTSSPYISKNEDLEPLSRSICKIIYVLCKVRGVKVITRFLNNEPKYLEPILRAFIAWDDDTRSELTGLSPFTWEEKYVMLLWLSHLFLAPFDLASISSDTVPIPYDNLSAVAGLLDNLPSVTLSALSITLKYAMLPGKESEAAINLLARLALRPDMQKLGLMKALISWAFAILNSDSVTSALPALLFISRLGVQSRADDLAPYIVSICDTVTRISSDSSNFPKGLLSSASARQAVTKILRSMTILTLTLDERANEAHYSSTTSTILEDSVDYFLITLADKDTPVRFAASKALSMITLKLDPGMASDIVGAILEALEENIFFENCNGTMVSHFQMQQTTPASFKRNTSAVDSQRWQGLLLTLGHLLFRRALPLNQLNQVLQSLIAGLDFQKQSSTGSSIGGSVRDASCFGIWSVARKYSTLELHGLDAQEVKLRPDIDESVLQILATELVCSACLDPSGNIRRGASAALQELVGRHPDTISEGISLVQIVDYHAIARRTKAMDDVTRNAASLGMVYWKSLLDGLLGWRGIESSDPQSRRTAASSVGKLGAQEGYKTILIALRKTVQILSTLSPYAIEARHGCFLSIAALIDTFLVYRHHPFSCDSDANEIGLEISKLWNIFDNNTGLSTDSLTLPELRPDLTAEASAVLLSSLSRSSAPLDEKTIPTLPGPTASLLDKAVGTLTLCACRGEDVPIEASSKAACDLFILLSSKSQIEVVQQWLHNIQASWKSATGRGQIAAVGSVFKQIPADSEGRCLILNELLRSTAQGELILKRSSAVKYIITGILPYTDSIERLLIHFQSFLNDYTTDRRGDIGSFIRLEAIDAVNFIIKSKLPLSLINTHIYSLMKCITRLAAEKLDKVRFKAWKCLELFWESETTLPPLQRRKYEHINDVSSVDYFLQLFLLLSEDWIRPSLLKGLVTSASAGSESLIQSSRLALVQHITRNSEDGGLLKSQIFNDVISILESTIDDDRYAIPSVDTLTFLLENCFDNDSAEMGLRSRKLFVLTQKFHFKCSNIPRIEAAVKLYAVLLRQNSIRMDVLKKMISMLLHPYPKIRSTTAECLFMSTGDVVLKLNNWSLPSKELKGVVENIQRSHGLS
ncbi:hypothetical protein LOZ12_003264 [Ophidiomyces ophidiicola]|uniref:Uncharacterized protein n=1 Tax=Ophidiomyces ophidiicola TaxID=1387563 RepID=A0ACB8UU34_9EURO|nr:hypothetical protein LOZ62_003185 [Ophidiomyces ophidiicola]KAI1971562.1 hypothetical protein LOZ56_002984 [Ophidiomyces ophidiicola]KAI2019309.1 hypothetical protein LOZ46_003391 [Ophidiomyces ophidiicola]KAI2050379.1 hypothetical protein LOZ38_003325 [Ophidiomyces ophidiicola]KAI2076512.1 hypothetical protein LOZ37_003122 [Ophidiomyces ophidiicola]